MPLPAGYTEQAQSGGGRGGPPPGYTEAAPTAASSTPGPQTSLAHDFLSNSPVGAVVGMADAIRDPKAAVTGALDQNAQLLSKAKDSYDKGNYTAALFHTLNYVLNGIPGLGGALDEAGTDFADGHTAKGTAKTLGLATTLLAGAKAPAALDAITAPELPGQIAAATTGAVKGAAKAAVTPVSYGRIRLPVPAPIAGAATGGYAATQLGLPHEVGAVVGGALPIVRGAIEGARNALAENAAPVPAALPTPEAIAGARAARLAAVQADTASTPSTDLPAQPATPAAVVLPTGRIPGSMARAAAMPPAAPSPAPAAPSPAPAEASAPYQGFDPYGKNPAPSAPAVTQVHEDLSRALAGKPYAKLTAAEKQTIDGLAAKVQPRAAAEPATQSPVPPAPAPVVPAKPEPAPTPAPPVAVPPAEPEAPPEVHPAHMNNRVAASNRIADALTSFGKDAPPLDDDVAWGRLARNLGERNGYVPDPETRMMIQERMDGALERQLRASLAQRGIKSVADLANGKPK